jgi:hypothetical protein
VLGVIQSFRFGIDNDVTSFVLPYVAQHVLQFLSDPSVSAREAAVACCATVLARGTFIRCLLVPHISAALEANQVDSSGRYADILFFLVRSAVSDGQYIVRLRAMMYVT